MKKWKYLIFAFLAFFLFELPVYAAGASISSSSTSVYVGDGFTVYVNTYSTAAWNVHVSASGPVSGCTINEVGDTGNLSEAGKSFSASCTATGEGTISLALSGDVTNGSGETQTISGTVNVFASKKPTPSPSPSPSPSNNNNNNNNNNNKNNTKQEETKKGEEKSKNNNLKKITVEGYELVKVDDTHYTLNVKNSVDHVVIHADVEDGKATVKGVGTQNLKTGENKIELVVTAEDGSTKTYVLTITRRDTSYKLKQLEDAIRDTPKGIVEIVLEKDDIISSSDLEKMKKSGKTFEFTYYGTDSHMVYSWLINGKNIDTTEEMDTGVVFTLKDREDFDEAMEFKDGILLNFAQRGVYPYGARVRIYVGDHYKNGDFLTLYEYDAETKSRSMYVDGVQVLDGVVNIDLEDGGVFFLTKAKYETKKSFNIFVPISIAELFVIILLLFVRRRKKEDKEEKKDVKEGVPPEVKEEVPVTTPETVPSTLPAPSPVPAPAIVETTPVTTPVTTPEETSPTTPVAKESLPATAPAPSPVSTNSPETLPAPSTAAMPEMPVISANASFSTPREEKSDSSTVLTATPVSIDSYGPVGRVY